MTDNNTLKPEVQAVLDEVGSWMLAAGDQHFKRCRHMGGIGGHCYLCAVAGAYRAYLATKEPEGVRPEDVEPGTRFRFAPGIQNTSRELVNTMKVAVINGAAVLLYVTDRNDVLYEFRPEDRIIPIKD